MPHEITEANFLRLIELGHWYWARKYEHEAYVAWGTAGYVRRELNKLKVIPNIKIIYTFKIHRTHKKREPKNWMEFEITATTIVTIEEWNMRKNDILEELSTLCDNVADRILGYPYGFVSEDNIKEDYDTEDTTAKEEYPLVSWEALIRNTTYPGGVSRSGSETV